MSAPVWPDDFTPVAVWAQAVMRDGEDALFFVAGEVADDAEEGWEDVRIRHVSDEAGYSWGPEHFTADQWQRLGEALRAERQECREVEQAARTAAIVKAREALERFDRQERERAEAETLEQERAASIALKCAGWEWGQ